MGVIIKNAQWMRNSFLLGQKDLSDVDVTLQDFTEGMFGMTDTSPGGALCINPLPQFTRNADIKIQNPLVPGISIGRYYQEAIEDRQQNIYMRFGVPQFNSLTQFFTGFYSAHASLLARTGRTSPGATYYLGRMLGFAVTILNVQLILVSTIMAAYDFFTDRPRSRFYYFKPAQHLYYNSVTTMVNHYCVNRGIIPRVFTEDVNQKMGGDYSFDPDEMRRLSQSMPDVIDEKGQVDVYRIVGRAHRRRRLFMRRLEGAVNTGNLSQSGLNNAVRGIVDNKILDSSGKTYQEYLDKWFADPNTNPGQVNGDGDIVNQAKIESTENSAAEKEGLFRLIENELDDGTAFVGFRVNATGEVSESFSNQTTASEIEGKINGMASKNRSTSFSMANGNVGGIATDFVNAIGGLVSGVTDQLGIAGLAVLGGAAFVDIPQHWESSVAQLPSTSYTVPLVPAYGNPISQVFGMYVPLFLLLAGVLPRSTGKQSYTAPYLVQLFDKGKQQTRLGIIDSMTIRRGITNLAFNRDGQAMGIEVTFTVKELSSVVHAPIAEGFSFNPTKGIFDEDTAFSDLMAVYSGMSLEDQIYNFRKLKLNLTRWSSHWSSWTSTSHIANFLAGGTPLRLLGMFYKGIER